MPVQEIEFTATPPPLHGQDTKPILKVCEWAAALTADGMPKVALPVAFRSKWMSDPVRNPEWRAAIALWDHALQECAATVSDPPTGSTLPLQGAGAGQQPAGSAPPTRNAPPVPLPPGDWESEPTTTADLQNKYQEQFTVASECGKASLLITDCGKIFVRAGENAYQHSKMKVIAAHSHGAWVKPPMSIAEKDGPMAFPFIIAGDTESVVLESRVEGRLTMKDTERCPLRTMLIAMEAEGFVDTKLHGHTTARPDGAAASDMPDFFTVTAIADTLWVWKARAAKDKTPKSQHSILSWVPAASLRDSPTVEIAWRVNYDINASTLIPKRVVVFLKNDLSLAPNTCLRIV